MGEKRITYSFEDLARVLLAHEGIHEGYWEVGFEIQGQAMMTAKDDKDWAPSLILRFTKVNLVQKLEKTPASITPK